MTEPVNVHNSAYVCQVRELKARLRNPDPRGASEAETRAFYAKHPARLTLGQSVRSRAWDIRDRQGRKVAR